MGSEGGSWSSTLVRTHKRPPWHPSYPPRDLLENGSPEEVAAWFVANAPAPKQPDATATVRERQLARLSVSGYLAARREGSVTCEEYVAALIKRVLHYSYLNAFMYMGSMPQQFEQILEQARALDRKALEEGVEAIAPLYGLPVPAKGTMATTDFPSSCGVGLLHECYAVKDAAAVATLRAKHGIVMGKTNVPEFAASTCTCNYANGCTMNPYDHALIPGGSSGGAACAVAAYLSPIALTEDTGGSTRIPAFQNQNFGYDPSRNHYPNAGNAGITYTNDQMGVNARSLEDILAFDAAFLGTAAAHAEAAAAAPSAGQLRVGLPQWPFVEYRVPDGFANLWGMPHCRISQLMESKYEAVQAALQGAGVGLARAEWPDVDVPRLGRRQNMLAEVLLGRVVNGEPCDCGILVAMHAFTGQVSQFVHTYLGAPVSLIDLIADCHNVGNGHGPRRFMEMSGLGDESQFRYLMAAQPEIVRVYNTYFDEHGVDIILVPGLFIDAITWEGSATTNPMRVFENGAWTTRPGELVWGLVPTIFTLKNIPIPKLMVPTGLDDQGRPTGIQLWGRAPPPDRIYDDEYAKTFDLDFLYKARTLVGIIQADAKLRRADAPLVADLFDSALGVAAA